MRGLLAFSAFLLFSQAALAQSPTRVAAAAFARDPGRYLNHPVRIDGLGCLVDINGGSLCTSYKGLYVTATRFDPPATAKTITDNCGGIVESEDDPSCTFDIVFTPTASSKGPGQVVQGDRSVTTQVSIVTADVVSVSAHR